MCVRRLSPGRRAFTLVELLVVIAIIIAIAAMAAAFMPRVNDSTNLTSAVDQLSQWLLTAKMRAKRDGLTTGLRLIPDANNATMVTSCQYVQQPDPLVGGVCLGVPANPPPGSYPYTDPTTMVTNYYRGGLLVAGSTGSATFLGVDFTGGQPPASAPPSVNPIPYYANYLVWAGDFLEVRDSGGVQMITPLWAGPPPVVIGANTLPLSGSQAFSLASPTTNYRILRQPRPVLGENPLQLPGSMAVDLSLTQMSPGVLAALDILFSPSGSVVGSNAGAGKVFLYVHDMNDTAIDPGRSGVVAVQTFTGYIGAYNAGPVGNPYVYATEGRTSGF